MSPTRARRTAREFRSALAETTPEGHPWPPCCLVAVIRSVADGYWNDGDDIQSDREEARAADLAKEHGITVPRDHNPFTCTEEGAPR